MVGVVAAVRHWVTMNHETRLANIEQRSNQIIKHLTNLEGVKASLITNIIGHQPFGVKLMIDESLVETSLQDVVDRLKSGTPPIWTRVKDGEDHIEIHIFGLNPGEEDVVGKRLADIFK